MRKIFTLIVLVFLMAGALFAQTNRMSYQAVLRNANNELVYNENVSVHIEIRNASGVVQYSEQHSTSTNANGMTSLTIGNGTNVTGNLSEVVWQNAVIRSVFTLSDGATITQTTPVTAVPYAMYAENAGNAFSGDYNDLENRPQIPTVPENVSVFNNDAGYITAADIPAETDPTVPAWAKAESKPTYDYSEIENTPLIPQVPENVSVFNNDAGYITAADIPAEVDPTVPTWAKAETKPTYDYSEIENTPLIPQVPEDVSVFNNDAGYITAADIPAEADPTVPAWAKAETKPTYDYSEIENTPQIPQVPEDVSVFNNDAGYITAADIPAETDPTVPAWAKAETKPTYDYAEIENTPEIPTKLSDLTNDVGYLTNNGCDTVHFCDLLQIIAEQRALIDSLSECVSSQQSFINKFPYASDGKPCPGNETVTDVDGNVYNTVKIGTQCWMKENMKSTKKADGTPLTLNSSFFYPNNDINNVDTYGYLYVWSVASTTQTSTIGICPNGWHLPTAAEWSTLIYYVGSYEVYYCAGPASGKALAANTGWNYSSTICSVGCDDMGVNNSTGFSAYPAGSYTKNSHQYYGFGQNAVFWQNDRVKDNGAGANVWVPASRSISYEQSEASSGVGYWSSGITGACSVRCLRN